MDVKMGLNEEYDLEAKILKECEAEFRRDIDHKVLWGLVYADKFPYSVKLPVYGASYPERYVWLNHNVGEDNWAQHDGKIYFKKEKDLAFYILRWA